MHRNRHRSILILQLLPQTGKAQSIPPVIAKQGYIDIQPLLRIRWSLTTTLSMYVVSLTSVSAADSPKSLFPLFNRRNSRNWQVWTHEVGEWQLSNELSTLESGKFQGKKQIQLANPVGKSSWQPGETWLLQPPRWSFSSANGTSRQLSTVLMLGRFLQH